MVPMGREMGPQVATNIPLKRVIGSRKIAFIDTFSGRRKRRKSHR